MSPKPLIYCALDTADLSRAVELAKIVGPVTKGLKLGLEFFMTFGPQGVEKVRSAAPSASLFIDLKFHDIPNTVAQAVKTISKNLAPDYLNVHAAGGMDMMEAAKAACDAKTKLLAVTVLTSLTDQSVHRIGYKDDVKGQVINFATMAAEAGLDGVVCSSHEIELINRIHGDDFILMVPGIRPKGAEFKDQKRVMTPPEAIKLGATHLVIGRPITDAADPAKAANDILQEIKS